MKFKEIYLKKDEVVPDSGTKKVDLRLDVPIQSLRVIYKQTPSGADYDDHPIYKDVDKIEVVDGSEVIFSLNGRQCLGLNFYERGRLPDAKICNKNGVENFQVFEINFARDERDDELGFDPRRYRNPVLQLTHTFETGTGKWTANGTKLTVIARVLDVQSASPRGVLMTKEIYSYTMGTSGEHTIELPRDYPYRLLGIQTLLSGNTFEENVSNVKLTCDMDRFVPFNYRAEDFIRIIKEKFGIGIEILSQNKKDNEVIYSQFQNVLNAHVRPSNDLNIANVESIDAEKITLQVLKLTTSPSIAKANTDQLIYGQAQGIEPHGLVAWNFGTMQDMNSWFDPRNYQTVQLKLTQSAAAECAIILQQLKM